MFLAEAAAHAGRVEEAREVIAGLEAEAATTPAPTLYRQLPQARNHIPGAAGGQTQAGLNPQNPTTRPAVTTVGARVIDEDLAQLSTGPACPVITPRAGPRQR